MSSISDLTLTHEGFTYRTWDGDRRVYDSHALVPASLEDLYRLGHRQVSLAPGVRVGDVLRMLARFPYEDHALLHRRFGVSLAQVLRTALSGEAPASAEVQAVVAPVFAPAPKGAGYDSLLQFTLRVPESLRRAGAASWMNLPLIWDGQVQVPGSEMNAVLVPTLWQVLEAVLCGLDPEPAERPLLSLTSQGLMREDRFVPTSTVEEMLEVFQNPVRIAEGALYRDFFALFRNWTEEDFLLLEQVIWNHAQPFVEEAARIHPDMDSDLEYLEVYPHGWDATHREDDRYFVTFDFHGWGPWGEPYEGCWEQYPDTPREGGIAIEYSPVYSMTHVPLRYNPECTFYKSFDAQGSVSLGLTVGDLVYAIFDEISFAGTPGDRNETRNEILGRAEDVMKDLAQEASFLDPEEMNTEMEDEPDES